MGSALLVLGLTACSNGTSAVPTTTADTVAVPATEATTTVPEVPSGPVNDRLIAQILAGGPTAELASQLFAVEVQPLPGVVPPAGDVSPVQSGTYAYMLAAHFYDQLPTDQQQVLDNVFVQGTDLGDSELIDQFSTAPLLPSPPFVPTTSTTTTTTATTATTPAVSALPDSAPTTDDLPATATTTTAGTEAPAAGFSGLVRPTATPDALLDEYFQPMYEWANNSISAATGRPKLLDFQLVYGPLGEATTWAASTTWHDGVRYISDVEQALVHACHSHIDLAKFANQPADAQLSVVTHEVFHCFQQDAASSDEQVAAAKPWVSDGEATWVQMELVPTASTSGLQEHWQDYASTPEFPLFNRRYDAAGFFGHVADVAGPGLVWPSLIPAFLAGGDDLAAFGVATAGVEDKVLDTWAASYFRSAGSQFLWDMKGPGAVNMPSASSSPAPELLDAPSGTSVSLPSVGSWQLALVRLQPMADVITIITPTGHNAIIDAADQMNKVLTSGEPLTLCLISSCACPAGSTGNPPPTIRADAPLDIGLTGGRSGATGWVHASSLSDFCTRDKLPDPPAGGGGGGGASSGGTDGGPPPTGGLQPPFGKSLSDPHLVTFDGRWYDLHAVGEFALARDASSDFEVQVRFQTRSSRTWSTATMMATRVGTDRVTVSLDLRAAEAVPVLRVNGEQVDEDFRVLDGGSVRTVASNYGDSYVVEFTDGTRVGAESTARGGLTVWVDPSPTMHGTMTGLLGDADGTPDNDPFVAGTSTVLSAKPSYDELYGAFAASWRLTQSESLMDYRPGETTATFTDTTFPDRDTPAATQAALDDANQRCADAGVSDAELLAACAFDVAATGDHAYTLAYEPQQIRTDTWRALTGTGTVATPTGSSKTKSTVFDGDVATASTPNVETFQGFAGDVIFVDPTGCIAPQSMTITDPDGELVGGLGLLACGDRIVLPTDGTYQVDMNPRLDTAGTFHVPISVVRPDLVRNLRPGDTMTGTIATRAEHDVFNVQAKAGDALTIGGPGCTGDFDVTVQFGDQFVTGGASCNFGSVDFPSTGTYQIVINGFNATTGDYAIPTSG